MYCAAECKLAERVAHPPPAFLKELFFGSRLLSCSLPQFFITDSVAANRTELVITGLRGLTDELVHGESQRYPRWLQYVRTLLVL